MTKGNLKKIKGKLKIALGNAITTGLEIGGLVVGSFGGLGLVFAGATIEDNARTDYLKSPTYISMKADDIEKLTRSLKAGEITENEYFKKREYLDSIEYRDELLSRNYPQDYEFQARLKTAENIYTAACITVLASAGIAIIGAVFKYNDVGGNLIDSGEKDLRKWSYTVSTKENEEEMI